MDGVEVVGGCCEGVEVVVEDEGGGAVGFFLGAGLYL